MEFRTKYLILCDATAKYKKTLGMLFIPLPSSKLQVFFLLLNGSPGKASKIKNNNYLKDAIKLLYPELIFSLGKVLSVFPVIFK